MSAYANALPFGRLTALLCLVSGLVGCTVVEDRQVAYATWEQQERVPRPHVEWVPVSHAIAFAPRSQNVSDIEREALLRFLEVSRVKAGDAVILTVPPPEPGQPDQAAGRTAALRALLTRHGILSNVRFGGIPGLSDDEILVSAQTLAVVAPDCPGYNTPIELDFDQRPILNFGCSNAANLGLMVANPADLVAGRDLGPADGELSVRSIQRYRANGVWPQNAPSSSVPYRNMVGGE